uniref:Uncharacterized protein n=1 Tax=Anguilla anguilla TaxID=7936 RepID=A0A0E9P6G1_ANGAN
MCSYTYCSLRVMGDLNERVSLQATPQQAPPESMKARMSVQ